MAGANARTAPAAVMRQTWRHRSARLVLLAVMGAMLTGYLPEPRPTIAVERSTGALPSVNEAEPAPPPGDWYNLQSPALIDHTLQADGWTVPIFGQIFVPDASGPAGPVPGIRAQIGFGPAASAPGDGWSWHEMTYNPSADAGNNDEYMGCLLPTSAGSFDYFTRWSADDGASWFLSGLDGPGATSPGRLTVVVDNGSAGPPSECPEPDPVPEPTPSPTPSPTPAATSLPELELTWYNLRFPAELYHALGSAEETDLVFGQVFAAGHTGPDGPATGIRAQVGFGPTGTLPSDQWTWHDMVLNPSPVAAGNNDEYMARLRPTTAGAFHYVTRWSIDDGAAWLVSDLVGPGWNGSPGVLTVVAEPEPSPEPTVGFEAPVVDAGPDQTVDESSVVQLEGSVDGSASEPAVSWSWTQTSGTEVILDDTIALAPAFTAPVISSNETLVFRLTATDGGGRQASDEVSIMVVDLPAPTPSPTPAPGGPALLTFNHAFSVNPFELPPDQFRFAVYDGGSLVSEFTAFDMAAGGGWRIGVNVPPGGTILELRAEVPVGWLALFSGDCAADGLVSLTGASSPTCQITSYRLDASEPEPNAVLVVDKTFPAGPLPPEFPLSGFDFLVEPAGIHFSAEEMGFVDGVRRYVIGLALDGKTADGLELQTSEDPPSGWQPVFGADCDAAGRVVLHIGTARTCAVANHEVDDEVSPLPPPPPPPTAGPVLTGTTPASPSSVADITVRGTGAPLATARIYLGAGCSGVPAASVVVGGGGVLSATVTVPENATTQISADQVVDGQTSGCSAAISYVEDSLAPDAPGLTHTDPASPSSATSVDVHGFAEPGSSITLFRTADCLGTPTSAVAPDIAGSFSVLQLVDPNSVTTFSATATDAAGNVSSCSVELVYINSTPIPAPVLTGTNPASPSSDAEPAISGTGEPHAVVRLYLSVDCSGTAAASTTANDLGQFSVSVAVPGDATSGISADQVVGPTTSDCGAPLSYVHDGTAPQAPVITDADPPSPSSSATPTLLGAAEPFSAIDIFASASCDPGTLAGGTVADGNGEFDRQVQVAPDATTSFSALSTDAAGNASPCSATLDYANDSTSPDPPVISHTDPASPSEVTTPVVRGTAEAFSEVRLYRTADCTLLPIGTTVADETGAWAHQVSVSPGATTSIGATAADAVGNVSACSTPLDYVNTSSDTPEVRDFGLFDADAAGHDWANAYLLALLSHYVYEDTAMAGTPYDNFQEAFAARFNDPANGVRVSAFFNDTLSQTQGAIVETDDAFIVVFRGTESDFLNDPADAIDWVVDIAALDTDGVHSGFAFAASRVMPALAALAADARAEGRRVWLTGHSLGGAVATVLARQLELDGLTVQGVYTYGAPRVFSDSTAIAYDALFAARPTQRWVNDLDPVTHVPPTFGWFGYSHVGQINNIVPSASGCLVQLDDAERLLGYSVPDHFTPRYLGRMYQHLPADLQSLLPNPPVPHTDPEVQTGCTDLDPLSAEAFAREAFASGRDALWAAQRLAMDFAQSPLDLARSLLAAGYEAALVARALFDVAQLAVEDVIDVLLALNLDAVELSVALWVSGLVTTAEDLARFLADAGLTAGETLAGLLAVLEETNLTAELVRLLKLAGFGALDILVAIDDYFGGFNAETLGFLRDAGFTAAQLLDALVALTEGDFDGALALLKAAGFSALELVVALWESGVQVTEEIVGHLKAAGYSAAEILGALVEWLEVTNINLELVKLLKAAGFGALDIWQAIDDYLGGDNAELIGWLRDAGFTVFEILEAMAEFPWLSREDQARALREAGFSALEVVGGLWDFGIQVGSELADLLAAAGFSAVEVIGALWDRGFRSGSDLAAWLAAAGFGALDVVTALLDRGFTKGHQLTEWLKGAGFRAVDIAAALFERGFTKAADMAAWLKNAGFEIRDIAQALKEGFLLGAADVVDALQSIGAGARDIVQALKDVFLQEAFEVAELLRLKGFSVSDIADSLKHVFAITASQLTEILARLGISPSEIAQALRNVFLQPALAVAELLGLEGFSVSDIAGALKTAFGLAADQVADILKSLAFGVVDIASALKTVFGQTASQAASILKSIGFTAIDVARALKDAFFQTASQAVTILKSLAFGVVDIASALKTVFGQTASQAASILKKAAFSAIDVARALKDAFSQSASAAASTLRNVAFGVIDVARALKDAFSQSASAAAGSLRSAGFAVTEVADGLKDVFNQTAGQAANLLKGAGFTVSQVGTALKKTFSQTSSQATSILKSAGFTVTQVATALKDVFGRSASQAISLLAGAAYSINDIATALKNAYSQSASEVAKLLWNASYGFFAIVNALVAAFNLAFAEAVALMNSLGFF